MIKQDIIQEITHRLVAVYNPVTIYLFGSHAWGHPDEESDLDFLVVVEQSTEHPCKRSIKAADALWDLKVPKDLLVYTKQEFEERENDVTTLIYKIKKDGKVLYARA